MRNEENFSQPVKAEFGTEYFSWTVDEYPQYDRGLFWYVFTVGTGIALLVYSVVTANFLFALIIVMFSLVMYMTHTRAAGRIRFAITDGGVVIGETLYPYKDIKRYWFVYEPPEVKNIYFELKSALSPRITVDLGDKNPNEIREVLGRFVYEDFNEDEEPISDFLARFFKL